MRKVKLASHPPGILLDVMRTVAVRQKAARRQLDNGEVQAIG